MRALRVALAALLSIAVLGSVATGLGYAWYLRSDGYRTACSEALSRAIALPSRIGQVVPRARSAREFRDIDVWLPGRRLKALHCNEAVLRRVPSPDDPAAYQIELRDGQCEISTRTWLSNDYRTVVESGLRPGFDPDGPHRVRFSGMDVAFERDRFRASLDDAAGVIDFVNDHVGQATVTCRRFNGQSVAEPVALSIRFSPAVGGVQIDQLSLDVPPLPLRIFDLGALVGASLQSGSFAGRLDYSEEGGSRRMTLQGKCLDLRLSECTAGLVPSPWAGVCPEIELTELTLRDRVVERVRFHGLLKDMSPGDVLATLGITGIQGRLDLHVDDALVTPAGIERFVARGRCEDVSLEAVTKALGWGVMTGNARLVIDDLTIERNHLASLTATFRVDDAGDPPNWVEGRLLREAIQRTLKLTLPPLLPAKIEYVKLGVRIEVRDEIMTVFGTHGEKERTILTVRLLEQDVALVNEPRTSYELTPELDKLRAGAEQTLRARLAAAAAAASTAAAKRSGDGG
ncbi:hypothetical protein RAS1_40180 [Phycisphaerae bacterium RAS1]|nr:hypothetical protein RAS1_40180 [Phycisphaerae bacterium RAS1]